MATNFPSSFVEFHGTKVGGEEEGAGEATLGTGGADETTIEIAEGEGGGVGHQETVEDRHVTVEAGTTTVTVTTPVDTTVLPASAEDPLLQVVVGTLCHLTVMENIHPLRILMGGRMDLLPPEGLADMVLRPLEEVEGDMADPPDLHVLPVLVYWSLPTLFHLKAHLKMVAMVVHARTVVALLLREVAQGWVPRLVKDTELAPHPLAPLPPEETWDMDDEVLHPIWVVLPHLIREMDIMGAHPLPVVSHVLFTLLVHVEH